MAPVAGGLDFDEVWEAWANASLALLREASDTVARSGENSLILVGAAFIGLWLIGCRDVHPVSASIGGAVQEGTGTRLALADHATFAWEKVCIVGPYTSDDQVDAITGIPGAAAHAFDVRSSDTIDVLMFIDQRRIVLSIEHQRNRGDFGTELLGRCYPRAQAVFSVRDRPAGGWGNIGPSP
jgi:hypothetical protein